MPYTYTVKALLHDEDGIGELFQWMRVGTIKDIGLKNLRAMMQLSVSV